jgi:hypothetical protein
MSISLLHSTSYFQVEDKGIERGEKHYKSGHVESFSYADGELVGLVHASRRERGVKYEQVVSLSRPSELITQHKMGSTVANRRQ